MGKKKHKHGKKFREERHEEHCDPIPFAPAQVAGIAAAALQQINTPAFRQMMAGALGAAAQAFDQRRTAPRTRSDQPPVPPVASAPPPPPEPPAPPVGSAYRPTFETPELRLPPEAAQAIEQVAAQAGRAIESAATLAARAVETAAEAVERWARQQRDAPNEGGNTEPPSQH